jgi:hypothetical protein
VQTAFFFPKDYFFVGWFSVALSRIAFGSRVHAQGNSFGFITNRLVACYRLEGNARDATGNANDGQEVNVQFVVDRFGNTNAAALFNGVGSRRTCAFDAMRPIPGRLD